MIRSIFIMLACCISCRSSEQIELTINTKKEFKNFDRHKLLGSNLALWHPTEQIENEKLLVYLKDWNPHFLRMPGGSWSDQYFWNGNGVREGDKADLSKQIDFSGYAPGYLLKNPGGEADAWHGYTGVLAMHRYIKRTGAKAIVTVNAGSGNPKLAAEWVRFANVTHDFGVRYWEIGNELEGSWEMGHFLPDGSKMTGEIYAKRFALFAKAMKRIDPTIKIGGPVSSSFSNPFLEPLLKYAGEHIDFISFHSYPVEKNIKDPIEAFEKIFLLGKEISRIRELLAKYQLQPEIEIAITEWNSMVNEDRETGDLLNGLWSCVWIGEMMNHGIAFATQWDLLTSTEKGGHGLFFFDQKSCIPKSQYWAFYLWAKHMGNQFVDSQIKGTKDVYSIVTRSESGLHIMLVNASRDKEYHVNIPLKQKGFLTSLTSREYFWDYIRHKPHWSRLPSQRKIDLSKPFLLPPYSVHVIETSASPKEKGRASSIPKLEIFMARNAPADIPLEGWIFAENAKFVELTIMGPASLDRERVRTAGGMGQFYIHPKKAGKISVVAKRDDFAVTNICILKEIEERDKILWDFEKSVQTWKATSDFTIRQNDAIRPNQNVVEISLNHVKTGEGRDNLITFVEIPKTFPKKRIGGVVFDLRLSRNIDLQPYASLIPVLQSEGNHWIPLEKISLDSLDRDWKTFRKTIKDTELLGVMNKTYALRFLIDAKEGIHGSLYLDNVGFILRSDM